VVETALREYGPLLGRYGELLDFNQTISLPAPTGPALAPFLGSYLSYLGLTPGRNYALTIFDPILRRLRPLNVRVEAEVRAYDPEAAGEIAAFMVRTREAEAESSLWLDRFGRTLKEESAGFTLSRVETQAEATANILPLKPPETFNRLIANEELNELLNRLKD
jgi:hypothetical protein